MKHTVALVLTSVVVFGSSTQMMGADWPSFRGPNHDGVSAEPISWPKDGPKPLWKINVGIGHSAVSVVGDRAYTMGNTNDTDTIFSIDVATGKVVWTHSYPCNEKVGIKDYDGPFATPAVANGVVYTLSRKGDVFALNARDGKVIWGRNIVQEDGVHPPGFGGLAGSPLILGDKLIFERQLRRHGARREDWQDSLEIRYGRRWPCDAGAAENRPEDPPGHPLPASIDHRRRGRWHASLDHGATPTHRVNAPDPVVDGTKVFVTAGRAFGGALFDVQGARLGTRHRRQGLHRPCLRQWKGVCAEHQRRCSVPGLQQEVIGGRSEPACGCGTAPFAPEQLRPIIPSRSSSLNVSLSAS